MEYKWEWWWNENATKQKSTEKRYEEKETQSFGCSNHLMWCIFVCNVKRYGTWIAGEFDCMVLLCFVLQFFYLASGLTLNYYHQKSAIKCWLMHSNLSKSKYLLSGQRTVITQSTNIQVFDRFSYYFLWRISFWWFYQ